MNCLRKVLSNSIFRGIPDEFVRKEFFFQFKKMNKFLLKLNIPPFEDIKNELMALFSYKLTKDK